MIAGLSRSKARGRALELLAMVGLSQRAGIARPNSPARSSSAWQSPAPWPTDRRCCCHEPTGNLDPTHGGRRLLDARKLVRAVGLGAGGDHNLALADQMDRILAL
jgi:hypothetical protein